MSENSTTISQSIRVSICGGVVYGDTRRLPYFGPGIQFCYEKYLNIDTAKL